MYSHRCVQTRNKIYKRIISHAVRTSDINVISRNGFGFHVKITRSDENFIAALFIRISCLFREKYFDFSVNADKSDFKC